MIAVSAANLMFVGNSVRNSPSSWTNLCHSLQVRKQWAVACSQDSQVSLILKKLEEQSVLIHSISNRLEKMEVSLGAEFSEIRNLLNSPASSQTADAGVEQVEDVSALSWSQDERLSKYQILAQLQADEVIEGVRMLSKESLVEQINSAVALSKITASEGEDILQSSLIAVGTDLEEVYVIADCNMNDEKEEHALVMNGVESLLLKSKNMKLVFGTNMVLPVLIGESIHPDALSFATSRGIHLIIRTQDKANAVF